MTPSSRLTTHVQSRRTRRELCSFASLLQTTVFWYRSQSLPKVISAAVMVSISKSFKRLRRTLTKSGRSRRSSDEGDATALQTPASPESRVPPTLPPIVIVTSADSSQGRAQAAQVSNGDGQATSNENNPNSSRRDRRTQHSVLATTARHRDEPLDPNYPEFRPCQLYAVRLENLGTSQPVRPPPYGLLYITHPSSSEGVRLSFVEQNNEEPSRKKWVRERRKKWIGVTRDITLPNLSEPSHEFHSKFKILLAEETTVDDYQKIWEYLVSKQEWWPEYSDRPLDTDKKMSLYTWVFNTMCDASSKSRKAIKELNLDVDYVMANATRLIELRMGHWRQPETRADPPLYVGQ